MTQESKSKQQAQEMKAVMETIRRNRRFLVSSHINPEGDALGSAFALGSLLKRLGKQVMFANDGGVPEAFRFLPHVAPVLSGPRPDLPVDVSMIVDVPILSRIGSIERWVKKIPCVVCIDHHVSNQRFADVNWVDPQAAAAGEMIYRLYRAFRIRPNQEESLCMYVSLVTDTGSFRYMNTTPAVHRIAAELVATGVSPLKVSQKLFESRSPSDLKFLGTVLQSLRHSLKGQVAWLEVPWSLLKRLKKGSDAVDEMVNFPRSVGSAEVAFVLRETAKPGEIRVNLRSKGNIDVNRVAQAFGGGGHMAASGCTISGTMSQARQRVLKVVREALRPKR